MRPKGIDIVQYISILTIKEDALADLLALTLLTILKWP